MSPSKFVLDVDGVLTDGGFYYDQSGQKALKRFGPDDADALKLLSQFFDIVFVSADKRGFPISSSRVQHLGFSIFNVSSDERLGWISDRYDLNDVVYMGDGFYDARILNSVRYGITTSDSCYTCRISSEYITNSSGSFRAVSEASLHLLHKFYPNGFEFYCSNNNLNSSQVRKLIDFLT